MEADLALACHRTLTGTGSVQTTLAPERLPGLCLAQELELEVLLQLLVALSLMWGSSLWSSEEVLNLKLVLDDVRAFFERSL